MRREDLKIFTNPPVIHTERLRLRKFGKEDIFDVYKYASNKKVTKYLLWDEHCSLDYTGRYLSFIEKKYKRAEFYDWGIEYQGEMIGTVGFTRLVPEEHLGEVGFVLREDKWGIGIATEAARAVIKFGFETLRLHRIEARCIAENLSSSSVLEKCGMFCEGVLRESMFVKGRFVDIKIYSMLDKEYF